MPWTVTTWNVQNFARSDARYQDKLTYLKDTIVALGSDVIALQEILDEEALNDLASELGFHATRATPDGRGNRVAFLSRAAPIATEEINAWRVSDAATVLQYNNAGEIVVLERFSRPALRITVRHASTDLDLINAHLKSKLLTFPGGRFTTTDETLRARTAYFALQRRAAEATTLRQHASDLLVAGHNVLVLGDFNDGPEGRHDTDSVRSAREPTPRP